MCVGEQQDTHTPPTAQLSEGQDCDTHQQQRQDMDIDRDYELKGTSLEGGWDYPRVEMHLPRPTSSGRDTSRSRWFRRATCQKRTHLKQHLFNSRSLSHTIRDQHT